MSYDVGSTIDLGYLNERERGSAYTADKKSTFQEAIDHAYEVGTQFIFNGTQTLKAARRIPVSFP